MEYVRLYIFVFLFSHPFISLSFCIHILIIKFCQNNVTDFWNNIILFALLKILMFYEVFGLEKFASLRYVNFVVFIIKVVVVCCCLSFCCVVCISVTRYSCRSRRVNFARQCLNTLIFSRVWYFHIIKFFVAWNTFIWVWIYFERNFSQLGFLIFEMYLAYRTATSKRIQIRFTF